MMKPPSLQVVSRRHKSAEDNMIPLINIVFLLLIFFMIAGTIARVPSADIELPSTNLARQQAEPETLSLSLTADERFYLNGEELDFEALSRQVAEMDEEAAAIVSISADRQLEVKKLYAVLSLFSKVKGAAVNLRTLNEADHSRPVAANL